MKKITSLLIACLLSYFVIAGGENRPVESLRELEDSILSLLKEQHIPGMFLSLVRDDSVIFSGGIGLADVAGGNPVRPTTLFRMGSITKSFVALGILKLEKEGRLSLQDRVADWLPDVEIENPYRDTDPVRIVHLLEHTAGFDDMHFNEMYNLEDDPEISLDEMLEINPKSRRVRWRPGTRLAYSNPGYSLAGFIIEKATGVPYEKYLEEQFLVPLGMIHSTFSPVPENLLSLSKGYAYQKNAYKEISYWPIYHRPSGEFKSCAHDMSRFLQFMINEGHLDTLSVVAPEVIRLMETPTASLAAENGLNVVYARGNYAVQTDSNVVFRGHGGGIDGYSSLYLYNRELGVGFAFSKNNFGGEEKLVNLISQFLTKYITVESGVSMPIGEEEINPYPGNYIYLNSRHSLLAFLDRLGSSVRISVENDTLFVHRFLEKKEAWVKGEDLFFRKEGGQFFTLLTENDSGTPVLILNRSGYLEKVSGLRILTHRLFVFGSLFVMLVYLLFFLVWFIRAIFNRVAWRDIRIRLIPLLAVISLAGAIFLLTKGFPNNMSLGTINFSTLGVFLVTLLFALFAFWSLWWGMKYFELHKRRFVAWYYLLTSMVLVGFTLYLLLNNMIGLRMWAF